MTKKNKIATPFLAIFPLCMVVLGGCAATNPLDINSYSDEALAGEIGHPHRLPVGPGLQHAF